MAKINKEKQAAVPQKLLHELLNYNALTGIWTNKTGRGKRAQAGQVTGCANKNGYVVIGINGYIYYAHRLAWTYTYGDYPEGEQPFIDHINGRRDDNRITNLKASSRGENSRNQKMYSRNTSGVVGVVRAERWVGAKTKKNWYWVANWCDEQGKQRQKNFNIGKLGEEVAKQMATDFREQQIRLLELNFGIIYSDRHGT